MDSRTIQTQPQQSGLTQDPAIASAHRKPMSDFHLHLETQLFEAKWVLNPLVAAATPLLMSAIHLRSQTNAPDVHTLHETLTHETRVFENKAHQLGYRAPIILAARYCLLAFLDEMLIQASWNLNGTRFGSLLTEFQGDNWGGERFFLILQRAAEDPTLHVDLLELGYLALRLGYQGKFFNHQDNGRELTHLVDQFYHLIRKERGEHSKKLLTFIPPKAPKRSLTPHYWIPITVSFIIACAGILGTYIPYRTHLASLTTPIITQLETMTSPLTNPEKGIFHG